MEMAEGSVQLRVLAMLNHPVPLLKTHKLSTAGCPSQINPNI